MYIYVILRVSFLRSSFFANQSWHEKKTHNECCSGLQDILDGCALLTSALLCWFTLTGALYAYAIINHGRHVMLWNTN